MVYVCLFDRICRKGKEDLSYGRSGTVGYINHLKLTTPRKIDGMFAYVWGDRELFILTKCDKHESIN